VYCAECAELIMTPADLLYPDGAKGAPPAREPGQAASREKGTAARAGLSGRPVARANKPLPGPIPVDAPLPGGARAAAGPQPHPATVGTAVSREGLSQLENRNPETEDHPVPLVEVESEDKRTEEAENQPGAEDQAAEEEEEVLRRTRRPTNRSASEGLPSPAPVARSSRRLVAGKGERANGEPGKQAGKRRAGEKGTLSAAERSSGSALSTAQMIGIGVCVFVLLLIGVLAFSNRGGQKDEAARKAVEAARDVGENTPCPELVKLAEQSLAGGDRSGAVRYYTRAASRAEQDGNTPQARLYNMKAKDLMLTAKLKDR